MKTSPNDVSNQELLQEFRKVSDKVDGLTERVDGLSGRMDGLSGRMDGLSDKMDAGFAALEKSDHEILEAIQEHSSETDARFMLVENRLTRVEARMVTKDYLDDKLADQYSKIVAHTDKRIEKALS